MEDSTRGRRRDVVLVEAIRRAAREELDDHGYAGVTFAGVARRAHTSRPVLYRRYRSRAHLVADAMTARMASMAVTESTGSLREDVLQALRFALEQNRSIGRDTFGAVLVEADAAIRAEFAALGADLFLNTLRHAVETARTRGELGSGPVPDLALRAALDMFRVEVLQCDHFVTADFLDQVVDQVALPLFTAHAATEPIQPEPRR